MNTKTDKRKLKHRLNSVCRKLKYGMYVIDCRDHPCIITEGARAWYQDLYGSEFACRSLVTETPNSCSVMHCGPEPISESLAKKMAEYWKQNGTTAYLTKYRDYTPDALAEYENLDKIWHFETPERPHIPLGL